MTYTIQTYTQRNKNLINVVQTGLRAFNRQQAPIINTLPNGDAVACVRNADGHVVGGAYGEYGFGWLFIDTVWVSDAERGKGIGRASVLALENYAHEQGVPAVNLMTSSFQARPFYEKLGYRVFGENQDRPKGHTLYFLAKDLAPLPSAELPSGYTLTVGGDMQDDVLQVLDKGLRRHASRVKPIVMQWLGVGLLSADGHIIGGAYGNLFWDVFDLHLFWLHDDCRGQGWGKRILQAQEALAQEHGANSIALDTTEFQARPFYEKMGYQVFGTLPNRPPPYDSFFMLKSLVG
jgi:GNAT superfamily N-acetyltransferase